MSSRPTAAPLDAPPDRSSSFSVVPQPSQHEQDDALARTSLSSSPEFTAEHAKTGLLAGLTIKRVGSVTLIAVLVAASMVWFFDNEFLDLLVSTLCVGYTTMLLFTMASNFSFVQSGRVPREAAQIVAVIAGSGVGTVLTGIVKGRSLATLLTERLSGFVATSGLGIGFGCVVVAVYFYRERNARMRAELARMEAEFDASRAREEKQLLSARLQLLQAQVEPHFLFNTLANVQHLTDTDPTRASEMLGSLIRYLRAALPQMREQASTLAREIAMVQAYLEIQRVRMGNRLGFTIDIPIELKTQPMPPMMLISLVENAIKHGIDPMPAGGRIDITASAIGEGTSAATRVTVTDTGAGLSEHAGIGIGLGNIRERLATLYGPAARLDLHENVPHGVVASIEWPVAGKS
jgi:signal transduction histidine kinase